jgi:hypothetical protein
MERTQGKDRVADEIYVSLESSPSSLSHVLSENPPFLS